MSKLYPDDLDDFTYALMEGTVGKKNMIFEREKDAINTKGALYNMRDQVINQYRKEFPAIKFISEKTAQSIDSLNMQVGPLSIREIKEFYKADRKELEANPTDENMAIFDRYKGVIDGLEQAQSLERKENAQEKALLNPSKSKVMEIITSDNLIDPNVSGHRPTYYAISNDRYLSSPYRNSVVSFNPHESLRKTEYLVPDIKDYPSIDDAINNEERESIVKSAFEKKGLKEYEDFKFVPLEKLQSMVNEHNLKNNCYGHIDFLSNSGKVVETEYFNDKKSFDKEVSASIDIGRPIICHIDKQFLAQIIDLYSKEFPSIQYISEKTARGIDNLNTQNGRPLSIKEIKSTYTSAGKTLEVHPTEENMITFDMLKDVSDGLKHAQFLEKKAVAQENALLNPSKAKVMEMAQ